METPFSCDDSCVRCQLPHKRLQPYVDCYVYRKLIVPEGCYIKKIMQLRSISSIDFFLGDVFETIEFKKGTIVPFVRWIIRPPYTHILHFMHLRGVFISFTIRFKATGLYKLLGIPMYLFVDKTIDGTELPFPLADITRRLLYAPGIEYCMHIIEPYLLFLIEREKNVPDVMDNAIRLLAQNRDLCAISRLANQCNLSRRQLERHFSQYIGISPKAYFRIQRFLQLLQAKNDSPKMKWGTLAHEFGYYDQMHLIREFRDLLNITPSSFTPSDFAF